MGLTYIRTVSTPYIDSAHSFRIQGWCTEKFGTSPDNWKLTSNRLKWQTWHFVRDEDAVIFSLKWL